MSSNWDYIFVGCRKGHQNLYGNFFLSPSFSSSFSCSFSILFLFSHFRYFPFFFFSILLLFSSFSFFSFFSCLFFLFLPFSNILRFYTGRKGNKTHKKVESQFDGHGDQNREAGFQNADERCKKYDRCKIDCHQHRARF
jgi:hypothetical protein